MNSEVYKVASSLRNSFESASNIFVDPVNKECEVTVSVDDFQGEIYGFLINNGVKLQMIDYSDILPFKYVFKYKVKSNSNKDIIPFNVCLVNS